MARTNTAYVSEYKRDRVHVTWIYAYEKTRLTANFNAAVPEGETITEAKWQTQYSYSALMSDGEIDGNNTSILIGSQLSGPTIIKCTVTMSNGQTRVQQFRINVLCQPYYLGDTWNTGPTEIVVTL